MATKINVKCNFASVFAKYNTVEELKELANSICAQVKTAYETRFAELASSDDEVTVEVSADVEQTQTETETKKTNTSKAKEAAAKFKKQDETAPKAKKSEEPKAKAEVKSDDLIAITDLAAIKKLGLKFEKYNDKCWVLRGNTKPLRKALKEQFKGVFNSRITGGEGWLIRTANVPECAKALGLKVKTA